jgi:hypothetical protein
LAPGAELHNKNRATLFSKTKVYNVSANESSNLAVILGTKFLIVLFSKNVSTWMAAL